MTTDRNDVGAPWPAAAPFDDPALLAALEVLRDAVAAPADGPEDGDETDGIARTRDAGLRAGVVMHSGYHPHVPAVPILAESGDFAGGWRRRAGRAGALARPAWCAGQRVDQQIGAAP